MKQNRCWMNKEMKVNWTERRVEHGVGVCFPRKEEEIERITSTHRLDPNINVDGGPTYLSIYLSQHMNETFFPCCTQRPPNPFRTEVSSWVSNPEEPNFLSLSLFFFFFTLELITFPFYQ